MIVKNGASTPMLLGQGGRTLLATGVADYSLQSIADKKAITSQGVAASGMLGLAAGSIAEIGPSANGLVGSIQKYHYEEGINSSFTNAFPTSSNSVSPVFKSYLFQRLAWSAAIDNGVLGGVRSATVNGVQKWLAN